MPLWFGHYAGFVSDSRNSFGILMTDEVKMLNEAMGTVKIHVQQMKRFLVTSAAVIISTDSYVGFGFSGDRPTNGCTKKC